MSSNSEIKNIEFFEEESLIESSNSNQTLNKEYVEKEELTSLLKKNKNIVEIIDPTYNKKTIKFLYKPTQSFQSTKSEFKFYIFI